ncbi:sacI homology domain protein [Colletotrichum incanum]|nr:sacI homology domain protein [Colletotrichum incanum]
MPGIARKIVICAAVDGLIIQPFVTKGQRPAQPVRIKYGDASITPASREQIPDVSQPSSSFEAFGVIGLITVSRLSYLITITRRQQVAQICGFPVYVVTEVAVTPCISQQEAGEAIAKTALELQDRNTDKDADDSDSDDYVELPASGDEVEDPAQEAKADNDKGPEAVKSTVAKDVIGRRGSYEKVRDSVDLRSTEKKFLLTIISRRSTQRAGLRYLRRGIDEQGYVANAVETEQILSSTSWDKSSKIYSFLQIRGSIPLFFTQSPVSLKPAPVIQHSPEANYNATRKHLERLKTEYGGLQIVNLVEKHGVEATVGNQYEKTVQRLNEEDFKGQDEDVAFEWFDFHSACRGMKFENVSQLLEILRDKLEGFGSTVEEAGQIKTKQQGVLRTNCMDCLDRTNVCQSSFGKFMLEAQLKAEGYDLAAQVDQQTHWFNTLWADNGDAVSKQYASTAAMKGDYTRTRKRNLGGTLNDLGLSLTRYYNGMVNDYFSQAAIDFLLGNVNSMVFQEFEAEMMTKDPAVSMLKMREQAIELSQKRVISDESEEFMGGWVLFSPHQTDTLRAMPFEEVVLLLTDAALYLCRFDWNMDKVSSFERIDLAHVVGIKFGTYIISTVSPGQTDEMKNVGFVVSYQPGKNDVTRTNTRTFSNLGTTKSKTDRSNLSEQQQQPQSALSSLLGGGRSKVSPMRKIAFKAPYSQSSAAVMGEGSKLSEIQQVVSICAEIERLAFLSQPGKEKPDTESIIEKGDIISLEEARQSTGLLDHISYSLKRLVWA